VLPEVDFVVVSCPLTAETRGAIGSREFERLKPGAGLVNIARAPIVDYEAMARALDDGRLSGAVLDVFDEEPLPTDSKWWETKNLLVMPHVAADDPTYYLDNALSIFADNAARLLQNAPLRNVVDRQREY
jgi:phosphoglycerate dehydrogenase-like enzyme